MQQLHHTHAWRKFSVGSLLWQDKSLRLNSQNGLFFCRCSHFLTDAVSVIVVSDFTTGGTRFPVEQLFFQLFYWCLVTSYWCYFQLSLTRLPTLHLQRREERVSSVSARNDHRQIFRGHRTLRVQLSTFLFHLPLPVVMFAAADADHWPLNPWMVSWLYHALHFVHLINCPDLHTRDTHRMSMQRQRLSGTRSMRKWRKWTRRRTMNDFHEARASWAVCFLSILSTLIFFFSSEGGG